MTDKEIAELLRRIAVKMSEFQDKKGFFPGFHSTGLEYLAEFIEGTGEFKDDIDKHPEATAIVNVLGGVERRIVEILGRENVILAIGYLRGISPGDGHSLKDLRDAVYIIIGKELE